MNENSKMSLRVAGALVSFLLLSSAVFSAGTVQASGTKTTTETSTTAEAPPAANKETATTDASSVQLPEIPRDLGRGKTAQFSVKVVAPQGGTLSLTLPSGFQAQPATYDVASSPKPFQWIFNVTPPARNQVIQDGVVQAKLVKAGTPPVLLGSDTKNLSYEVGQSLRGYYLFGLLGILVGYAMRKLMKAFSEAAPPTEDLQAMAADDPVPGWLKKFVAAHYYLVDASITLILGVLALYKLVTSDQRPPEDGLYPMGAVVLGFLIGLLTHSELVTRITAKGAAKLASAWAGSASRVQGPAPQGR
jgi:hypothetical protein